MLTLTLLIQSSLQRGADGGAYVVAVVHSANTAQHAGPVMR
jgi:hypothetical protein